MLQQWRTESDMTRARRRLRARSLPLVFLILVLLLLLPCAFAQDEDGADPETDPETDPDTGAGDEPTPTTTSSSSLPTSSSSSSFRSSATSFSSRSSSTTTTQTSSTSTKSAWEIAPTVVLQGENVTYNFTLNRTSPIFLARFAQNITDRAVGVILNIGELGQNQSEPLPKVIVTTTDNYLPSDGRRSRLSGGNAATGYNIGDDGAGSWQVVWDNGFGNWTYGIDGAWNVVNHTAVAPTLLIGRGINDDIVLDPAAVGGGNVTVFLGYTVLGESGRALRTGKSLRIRKALTSGSRQTHCLGNTSTTPKSGASTRVTHTLATRPRPRRSSSLPFDSPIHPPNPRIQTTRYRAPSCCCRTGKQY